MDTKKFRILNKAKDRSLSQEALLVDSTFEPLTVLRVMIEGLAHNETAGLWLTKISNLPAVPRISPFDIIYLDKDHKVVEATELLPATPMPRFKSPAQSALVLPFQTLSATETSLGDELSIQDAAGVAQATLSGSESIPAGRVSEPSAEAAAPGLATAPDMERASEPEQVSAASAEVEQVEAAGASQDERQIELPEPEANSTEAPVPAELLRIVEAIDRVADDESCEAPQTAQVLEQAESLAPVLTAEAAPDVQADEPAATGELAEADAEVPVEAELQAVAESSLETEAAMPTQEPEAAADAMPTPGDAKELLHASRSRKHRGRRQRLKGGAKPAFAGPRKPFNRTHFVVRSDEPNPEAAEPVALAPTAEQVAEHEAPAEVPLAPAEPRIIVTSPQPEFASGAVASARQVAGEKQKTEQAAKADEPIIGRFLRWLYPAVYQEERRGSIRLPNPGLVAYEFHGEACRKFEVGNISSSGIYLLTDEGLKQGATFSLTLQKNGLPEQRVDRRIELLAGAVRAGRDGVGLTFSFPHGVNLDLWDAAVKGNMIESGPDYIIREIRVARALGFLRRICSPAVERASEMLYKEFSNVRIANAIRIVLKAENLMDLEPDADELHAHPDMVIRILELGSWTDLDWMQDLWAGLLATSCTQDGQDESNLPFVEMLSQFAPIHLRILAVVCSKAATVERAGGNPEAPAYCTAGELSKALDIANLTKILRTIAELAEYGLLYRATRSASSPHEATAKTAVTPMGQQMYAHCHGERFEGTLSRLPVTSIVIPMQAYEEVTRFLSMRSY